jgi:hypothetical protein
MAITRYAGDRFFGLEAEKNTLLSQVMDGAEFTASDSLIIYSKINGAWIPVSASSSSGSSGSSGTSGVDGCLLYTSDAADD